MAIRVIEVPRRFASIRPRALATNTGEEPTIPMKKPVGVLGWTPEEHERYARTKEWPARGVDTPDSALALTLTSLPSQEYLRGFLDGLHQSRSKGSRGRRSELETRLERVLECLKEAGGRTEDARKLFVERRSKGSPETNSRQFSEALKILQTLWDSD